MRPATTLATLMFLTACSLDGSLGPNSGESRTYRASIPLSGGLIQTVEIMPFEPSFGDTIWIRSQISNPTRAIRDVSAQGCGVLLRSSAQLRSAAPQACFAGTVDLRLKPGESTTANVVRVLNDTTTGVHFIGVQHYSSPEFVMLIDLLVVAEHRR